MYRKTLRKNQNKTSICFYINLKNNVFEQFSQIYGSVKEKEKGTKEHTFTTNINRRYRFNSNLTHETLNYIINNLSTRSI